MVDEADVDAGGADRGETLQLLGDAVGLGERVEGAFVLEDHVDRGGAGRPGRGVAGPREHLLEVGGAEAERRPSLAELDRAA